MKVLLTGSTGFVGSRVLDQLLAHGHEVTALVRRREDASRLVARKVKPALGDLESLDVIAAATREQDAVVHLGFIHNFAEYDKSIKVDVAVTETFISALKGSGKKLITTSPSSMGGDSGDGLAVEGEPGKHNRGICEAATLKGVEQGVQSIVIRLPLHVYGESPFVSFMTHVQVEAAKKHKEVAYIGSGSQKFSVGSVDDVAAAYVAAVENCSASGIYNVATEQGITAKQFANALSKKLSKEGHKFSVRSLDKEEAAEFFKPISFLFSMNNDIDFSKAKKDFKWQPARTTGFLDTLAGSA